jgi:lipopolysaccharide/colanic/teichoic acid biosynthesis glycosyltransferase
MVRRIIDIVVSAAVLALLTPLFTFVAIAVAWDSSGGAFYRAWRVGKDGRQFRMLKFRSMVAHADRNGSAVTGTSDPRITRVGHFLRATKFDELPQFWNVLIGDMTLVGPRPEAPQFVKFYTPEQQTQILSVKPGLAGPGAISCTIDESMAVAGGSDADRYYVGHVLERRLAMDAEYVRNRTVARDLALIGRTCQLMVRALFKRPA